MVQNNNVYLIRLPEVMKKTGMGRSWVYRAVKDGIFPKPISVGGQRAIAWVENEVDQWISTQIKASRNS